ncbi:MAG TPA: hypothetical protein VGR54_02790 [Nitrosopumilaceae archaeon]|nr:hypothetical protein [Nitrosopumilaceae archaeon]
MDLFTPFLMSFLIMIFVDQIVPKIVSKKPILARSISLITLAVGFTFILSSSINDAYHKQITAQDFGIEMVMLIGYFLFRGLQNREKIHKTMRFSYYYTLLTFTFVFIILSGMAYLFLPYSKFAS